MTEAEWLGCDDPLLLLRYLRDIQASERKHRLFAAACCRRVSHLCTDRRSRAAIAVGERFADNLTTEEELRQAHAAAWRAYEEVQTAFLAGRIRAAACDAAHATSCVAVCLEESEWGPRPGTDVYSGASGAAQSATNAAGSSAGADWEAFRDAESRLQAELVRCVFNPFKPTTLEPSWQTPAAMALARSMYEERNFEIMPVLADALEEAGCADADILGHCRGPGPHVRGCWVLDLILAKF
jgi:hypothetical protein